MLRLPETADPRSRHGFALYVEVIASVGVGLCMATALAAGAGLRVLTVVFGFGAAPLLFLGGIALLANVKDVSDIARTWNDPPWTRAYVRAGGAVMLVFALVSVIAGAGQL